ncbi:beta-lactamase hydrolase domain-containing protein [Psychrobacter sp. FDAARGOS_221]|uniref:beta-lactamase hydrolase domain-containing protein n=1 Tax=Psychrobacter sp. FDAARGOS_221 TaxID=1975705 RepID=UPI000BB57845|nr:sulfur transferase domain-containing protein [Psychrobacter sp. FDAARGOS_221]PNK59713.1 serine/threonine protein phosphatase [Psychrobacter sp. FDAARGOS_221]
MGKDVDSNPVTTAGTTSSVQNNAGSSDEKSEQKAEPSLQQLLEPVLDKALFPDANTVVSGQLSEEVIDKLAEAGIEHVINLQPESELTFDEKAAVEAHGMAYTHLPIAKTDDLKQLNLLEFDKALRTHHGKKTLLHCDSGNKVGAVVALRAGWLRGRKMDTAMQRGKDHGLQQDLEQEVHMRLLVPR